MQHLFKKYKPHYVYHMAVYKHAQIVEDKAAGAIDVNILGIEAIVDFSVKYSIKINMLIITKKTTNPTNAMSPSKRIAGIYVQSLNKLICDKYHVFTSEPSNNDRPVAISTKQIEQEFKSKNRSLRN